MALLLPSLTISLLINLSLSMSMVAGSTRKQAKGLLGCFACRSSSLP